MGIRLGTSHSEADTHELGPFCPAQLGETDGIFKLFRYPPNYRWDSKDEPDAPFKVHPAHFQAVLEGTRYHDQEEPLGEKMPRSFATRKSDAACFKEAVKRCFQSQCTAEPVPLEEDNVPVDWNNMPTIDVRYSDRIDFRSES